MKTMNFTSQVTFLYFDDLKKAKSFFEDTLGLEVVYDPGWASIWEIGKGSFLGGVDVKKGSIEVETRGGVLISLTVNNIEEVFEKFKEDQIEGVTDIKYFEDINLKSFLFNGPEGYKFEVQQFMSEDLSKIF